MSSSIPSDMNAFNRKLIADFRATRGQMSGQMAGRQLLLLTTKGRSSYQPRTVVLGYRHDGDRYVMIASNNGSDRAPSWYLNLMADPKATVEVGPEKFEARASVAKPRERAELAKLIDYLAQQQSLTEREIPIVVLERI